MLTCDLTELQKCIWKRRKM